MITLDHVSLELERGNIQFCPHPSRELGRYGIRILGDSSTEILVVVDILVLLDSHDHIVGERLVGIALGLDTVDGKIHAVRAIVGAEADFDLVIRSVGCRDAKEDFLVP